jgi:hypothetical protein
LVTAESYVSLLQILYGVLQHWTIR